MYHGRCWNYTEATYYQFGRKDPMLPLWYNEDKYTKDKEHYVDPEAKFVDENVNYWFASYSEKEDVSLGVAIQHPHHFHMREPAEGHYVSDWCNGSYFNLWNAEQSQLGLTYYTIKTIYDPSPVGYCVPPGRAFMGFTYNGENMTAAPEVSHGMVNSPYNKYYYEVSYNGGWKFYNKPMPQQGQWQTNSGVNFWLALGYRYYGTGGGGHVGINGHFWSANPASDVEKTNDASYYFFFDRSNVGPKYAREGRSMGYLVRPVTEESARRP